MNIINKIDSTVKLSTLHSGSTFIYEGELFMLTQPFRCETIAYNTVCFNDGLLYHFDRDCDVVPCEVTVEITQKGRSK